MTADKDKNMTNGTEPLKVAIVGGGIAGLYCLYYFLKDKNQNIQLFESCNHLGGRIETWSLKRQAGEIGYTPTWDPRHLLGKKLGGAEASPYEDPKTAEYFRAEFGPMRIEPRDQPILREFLNELGIKEPEPGAPESLDDLIPFFPYTSKEPKSAKFALKGEEAEQKNIMDLLLLGIRRILEIIEIKGADEHWRNPKARKAWGNLRSQKSFYQHYWKGELLDWINHLDDFNPGKKEKEKDSDYYKIRTYFEIDGHPLWDMGFWNLMSDVLSHYAVVKIRDWGSYYHFLHENLNAAEWLIFWLKAIKGTHALRGIRGGMSRIIHALLFKLCELYNYNKLEEDIKDKFGKLNGGLDREIRKTKTESIEHKSKKNFSLARECEKKICRLIEQQKSLADLNEKLGTLEGVLDPNVLLYYKFNRLSGENQRGILKKNLGSLIKVKHELTGLKLIERESQANLELHFKNIESPVIAEHVILALPKLPLDKLATPLPQALRNLYEDSKKCEAALASVKCLPLLKCFFIVEHPWWTEDRKLNADAADIPTREITYSLSKDKTRGMIMIYTDHPAITFWSDYLREFKQAAEPNQLHHTVWWKDRFSLPSFDQMNDRNEEWGYLAKLWKVASGSNADITNSRVVGKEWPEIQGWWAARSAEEQKTLRKDCPDTSFFNNYFEEKEKQQERLWNRFVQFARDYEHHDFLADHLLACGIHDWGKAPFGAAAHGWLPGEKSRDHIEYLAAFPENGNLKGKIHVCGEAFSDYQGFIEGALRSATEALGKIGGNS